MSYVFKARGSRKKMKKIVLYGKVFIATFIKHSTYERKD